LVGTTNKAIPSLSTLNRCEISIYFHQVIAVLLSQYIGLCENAFGKTASDFTYLVCILFLAAEAVEKVDNLEIKTII
jgi:hypothetical protein